MPAVVAAQTDAGHPPGDGIIGLPLLGKGQL